MSQTYVISGGTSGIGAALVDRLLAQGALVFNLDVAPHPSNSVNTILCDLSEPAAIDAAVDKLPQHINGLVSCAGVAPGALPELKVMQINFLGMRYLTERLLPRVLDNGSVVTVASSAGRDWRENIDNVVAMLDCSSFAAGTTWLQENLRRWDAESYRFSKQCAAAYTYRAAGLAHDRGVRVNCINPGIVATGLSPAFKKMVGEARYDLIVEASGRPGRPDDVAEVAEYLLTGECRWLNGTEITVDGGYYAGVVGGWINI